MWEATAIRINMSKVYSVMTESRGHAVATAASPAAAAAGLRSEDLKAMEKGQLVPVLLSGVTSASVGFP